MKARQLRARRGKGDVMRSTVYISAMAVLAIMAVPSAQAISLPQPYAQDPPVANETPESRAVSRTLIVAHLVDWARANRDSGALLTAARMLDEVPMRTGLDGDVGLTPVLTPQGLRQEAAALGQSQTVVEDVVVTGSRVRRPPPASAETAAPPPAPRPPPPPPPALAPCPRSTDAGGTTRPHGGRHDLAFRRGAHLDRQATELARALELQHRRARSPACSGLRP